MERSIGHRLLSIVIILLLLFPAAIPDPGIWSHAAAGPGSEEASATWIIQWNSEPPKEFWSQSEVSHFYENSLVTVARPKGEEREWVSTWSESSLVESVQPNQKVQAARMPNDPLLPNQRYLNQIRADLAWDVVTSAEMVIAVVDTGVDLSHSELEGRLVDGVNLIRPGATPQDDNGHGTNVAGVIAAAGNNDKGTAGLLWDVKIMPIKALEADGNGDEDKLGEGIRYAVEHGARIVVLSLGLNKYSSYMERVVREAEEAGVLLVAASGNEGNAVKYPAAYDSVLAVGGIGADYRSEPMSNTGPELDLVAPWIVFTTFLGGGYDYKEGTSMAAPQVAGAAALAWSTRPELKPVELRNLLRQTAQDIGTPGWDPETGYGMLRVDRAVSEAPQRDIYEPNNRQNTAKAISSNKSITAYLEAGESDWFYWDAPYDGKARYRISGTTGSVELAHVTEAGIETSVIPNPDGSETEVKKGRHYVRISGVNQTATPYTFNVDYGIYRDPFEDNDRQYKAYTLQPRSQLLVGTFDHDEDQDWYSLTVDQAGTLQLKVTPDTARMDLVLTLVKKGGKELVIDHNGDGQPEFFQMEVTPGQYFIKVSNIPSYTHPVVGEYILDIHLATSYEDPYEPNDRSYQATVMSMDQTYLGVIDPDTDVDWYRFRLEGQSVLHVELNLLFDPETLNIELLDSTLKPLPLPVNIEDRNSWYSETTLSSGTYYFKVSSAIKGVTQYLYGLRIHADRLVGGYVDIENHWAEDAIVKLIDNGYVNGYGDTQLYPDRPVTRAEAAMILFRIVKPAASSSSVFQDVPSDHWAYEAINGLYGAGIVNGISATAFAPDRNITRMEMLTLLANATGKKGLAGPEAPFPDVEPSYWGSPVLRQLKQEGWAEGYGDGNFRPEQTATRAELMALMVKMLQL